MKEVRQIAKELNELQREVIKNAIIYQKEANDNKAELEKDHEGRIKESDENEIRMYLIMKNESLSNKACTATSYLISAIRIIKEIVEEEDSLK